MLKLIEWIVGGSAVTAVPRNLWYCLSVLSVSKTGLGGSAPVRFDDRGFQLRMNIPGIVLTVLGPLSANFGRSGS
jgi:hypothetical protein